jgi:D-alanyl-D-alanine carboxypeptidase
MTDLSPRISPMMVRRCLLLAVAAVVPFLGGCDDEPSGPNLIGDVPQFDPALFRQNIEVRLQQISAHNIGYTFVINYQGKLADSAQVGFARMPQDGGLAHTISLEMNIASVTKWLTAVGALRLLANNDLSLDDAIAPWLPVSWGQGTGVGGLTFRDLLTHRSGLTTGEIRYPTDYESLKEAISVGVVNPAKSYNYSNVNFALFRILFPYIDDIDEAQSNEWIYVVQNTNPAAFHLYLAERYQQLMQALVFQPAKVSNALMSPASRDIGTLMYYRFSPSENGTALGDWTLTGGGGGYFLAAWEVASVMAHVFHTDEILDAGQVQEMQDDLLGFDSSPSTVRGPSYQKDGALFTDSNGSGEFDNGDRGLQVQILKFPGDVEVVLFVNSIGNGWTNYVSLLVDAYEDAWVLP